MAGAFRRSRDRSGRFTVCALVPFDYEGHRGLMVPMLAHALTLVALAAGVNAVDLPYTDIFAAADSGGNHSVGAPISMWSPSFVVTRRNTLVINAQCDRQAHDHDSIMGIARSEDNGKTWTRSFYDWAGGANMIYSAATDTIFASSLRAACLHPLPWELVGAY